MQQKNTYSWLKYTSITAQLLVLIGLAVYLGIKLDEKLKMAPIFTAALPLLVLIGTFYKLIKETGKKDTTDDE